MTPSDEGAETMQGFKVDDDVRAFHPRMLGVVCHGRIVKVGRAWIHVDFGAIRGGTFKVAPRDIVN